jgi:hypothetical protein
MTELEFEVWFEEGVAMGFDSNELETLVPPSNAAELVEQALAVGDLDK